MTDQDDLRYPIGRFRPPAAILPGVRAAHIETLRLLPHRLRDAVAGLDDAQLDTSYREGGWSLRQVVHHLADSHASAYLRMKLALTEDWPTINAYDEAAWARLPDSRLPIGDSLVFVDGLHARMASLLQAMTEDDFQKGFVHPERGRISLAQNLAIYDWHARHHVAQITGLRQRMGW